MKSAKTILFAIVAVAILSFTNGKTGEQLTLKTGKYGTCGCASGESAFELTINADSTFSYYDHTGDPRVDASGRWSRIGNEVVLNTFSNSIPKRWKIDDDSNCLKTRKGLMWIRICHQESCK